jgi:hypothetical protein
MQTNTTTYAAPGCTLWEIFPVVDNGVTKFKVRRQDIENGEWEYVHDQNGPALFNEADAREQVRIKNQPPRDYWCHRVGKQTW